MIMNLKLIVSVVVFILSTYSIDSHLLNPIRQFSILSRAIYRPAPRAQCTEDPIRDLQMILRALEDEKIKSIGLSSVFQKRLETAKRRLRRTDSSVTSDFPIRMTNLSSSRKQTQEEVDFWAETEHFIREDSKKKP